LVVLDSDSSAPDQRHDFDLITRLERARGVLTARNQVAIALDRYQSRLHLQFSQEAGDGRAQGDLALFSVDD
jgi:hypothetical protein